MARLAALVLLLIAVQTAQARVVRVPTPSLPTIQAGIDYALTGDTVLVADGVYTGPGNYNLDLKMKSILLISENGPEATIIDCQAGSADRRRGLKVWRGEDSTTVIDGFTIQGGYAPDDFGEDNLSAGGAILITNGSAPRIRNCVIRSNSAEWYGGGIAISGSQTAARDCTLEGNHSIPDGGAIWAEEQSSIQIDSCWFSLNRADRHGGAVAVVGSTVSIEDCTFESDSSGYDGGAVFAEEFSTVVLRACSFVSNKATRFGGGLAGYESIVSIDSCSFEDNHTISGGGAVYVDLYSEIEVRWTEFLQNSGQYGGAVWLQKTDGTFEDCVFSTNLAGFHGGGVYVTWSCDVTFSRCSLTDNIAYQFGGGCAKGLPEDESTVSFSESNISGNDADWGGGGVWAMNPAWISLSRCTITDNGVNLGAGVWFQGPPAAQLYIEDCIIAQNRGNGVCLDNSPTAEIVSSTICGNEAVRGSALYFMEFSVAGAINTTIDRCVVAFNSVGEAVGFDAPTPPVPSFVCTDIFGNPGGDWTAPIQDQLGVNDNISSDPLFCDLEAGDYTISGGSLCAPYNNTCSELLGAGPVGCDCTDSDGDGYGDPDEPGNLCPNDNCPYIANPDQSDSDEDGIGDVCDCCLGRVGDVNGAGGDEPTISDISAAIDALFISGDCGVMLCLAEADVNQSGGVYPGCGDITISDIATLIDYLFITGPETATLLECL